MGYFLFCLTTVITATFLIFKPAMGELKELRPNHNMIQYAWISYAVFACISMLTAPIMFFTTIIPSWSNSFKGGLVEAVSASED